MTTQENVLAEVAHHRDETEKSLESFKEDFSSLTREGLVEMINDAFAEGITFGINSANKIMNETLASY